MEIVVPDLGDFTDVEVIECLASPGDDIVAEAPLITVETDKAAMDVPSPVAGKLVKLTVAVGDRVSAGDVIAIIDQADDAAQEGAQNSESEEASTSAPANGSPITAQDLEPHAAVVPDLGDFAAVEIVEVLVAVGDRVELEQGLITVETDKAAMDVPASVAGVVVELQVEQGGRVSAGDVVALIKPDAQQAPSQQQPVVSKSEPSAKTPPEPSPAKPPASRPGGRLPPIDETRFGEAHASPAVRKLARELGVNLGGVHGSGHKNRITADDVKAYVKQILSGGVASQGALPSVPDVDHSQFGEVDVVELSRIQKISGPRLHASWVNLPHVTQHDLADFTATEERRKSLKAEAAAGDVRLTPLAFIIRACALALREFPDFRSSLSSDSKSLIVKAYTHIGFAADTPNGLMVPVIRDVDKKSVTEIAGELGELSALARDGKLRATQMQGGVFTVSSLGGIGGTYFTPIINAPEVAILGVSRSSWQPVFSNDEFVPRLMLPLSLSYDHRVIDGAQGARFITRFSEIVGDPEMLLSELSGVGS